LSALPLLMIWIYTSWTIVLFGASYARQRSEPIRATVNPEVDDAPPTLRLLSRVVVALWEHFHVGKCITAESIAQEIGVTVPVCRSALDVLCDHGLAECTGSEDVEGTEYLLRRHLGDLSLADLDALLVPKAVKKTEQRVSPSPMWNAIDERLSRGDDARRMHLNVTIEQVHDASHKTVAKVS